MARLLEKYRKEVHPKLREELGVKNPLAVPRLEKIVISMGIGQAVTDKKYIEMHSKELAQIAGQRPLVCKARKSVSNFKLREGQAIGLKVTLRGNRMYEFLDRLTNIAVPRVRDFRGLNPSGFDGRGNFSMGLSEQTVFPEVSPDAVERRQGMNITLVTSARDDQKARQLLALMGLPFATAGKE